MSFQLATSVDPNQPVAWMGLKNLSEKRPDLFDQQETIAIYSHLTDAFSEWVNELSL